MNRKTGGPDPKDPGGVLSPEAAQGRSEDAEETAREAEEDAARAENDGYPLGRPDEGDDAGSSSSPDDLPRRGSRGLRGAPPS
jgi:hypothetical protein